MTAAYARLNGREMSYEVYGAGRPLVVLRGAGQTIDLTFGTVQPAFAATRQVIAVELQGHGHTGESFLPG